MGVGFGQCCVDVEGDDSEEVDVGAVRWGDVSQDFVGDASSAGAEGLGGQ